MTEKIDKSIGAADAKLISVVDDTGKSRKLWEWVFPLVTSRDGERAFIGTGFFIAKFGLFMTAKHVLEEVTDKGKICANLYALQFPPNRKEILRRRVVWMAWNNDSDVGVGVCENAYFKGTTETIVNPIVTLSLREGRPGETVITYAHPDTHVVPDEIHMTPRFYQGKIVEYYRNGRDRVKHPAPCYQTSMTIHGGSSGGPVFNHLGHVIGVNSSSFAGMHNVSFIARVHEALGLEIAANHIDAPGGHRRVIDLVRYNMLSLVGLDADTHSQRKS